MDNNWTEDEFKAYLFLFAAHANFDESKTELNFIKTRVGAQNLAHIHDEFDNDNDYQRIQKIEATITRLEYKKADIENLLIDVKALFVVDGEFDILEESLFIGLRHLLLS
jgi:hypothetical protein